MGQRLRSISWFQSPQWGSNSKDDYDFGEKSFNFSFSPRNGEVILKEKRKRIDTIASTSFSPRNGEVILK